MDRGEFVALDTLQYGLARDVERTHRLAHRQEVLTGITVEAILEVLGEADAPRGARCQLLAGNNAVIEQAMDGRWCDAKHSGGLLDRQWFALRRTGHRLEAGNTPVAAQVADAAGSEAMTVCCGAPLPIEDAGNYIIGVMSREPAQQRDRVLVGADGGRPRARQSEVDLVERAALPAQREMGGRLVAIDSFQDSGSLARRCDRDSGCADGDRNDRSGPALAEAHRPPLQRRPPGAVQVLYCGRCVPDLPRRFASR